MADLQRIESVIDKLKAAKRSERSDIIDDYHELIKSGLTLEEGLRAIESSLEFPAPKYADEDNAEAMIGYLDTSRFPREHGVAAIPRILELYPSLSERAQRASIQLLMNIPEKEGAAAVMELVRRYFQDGKIPPSSFSLHAAHPSHADVYFPELLDYAQLTAWLEYAHSIWWICIKYCENGVLKPEQIISRSNSVAAEYRTLKTKLLPFQSQMERSKAFKYLVDREVAPLLLNLMRFFPTAEIKQELSLALVEYRDPVLLCWASISALWLGLPVEHQIIETIAASDEARNTFYEKLKEHNRTSIFPEKYRTKAAFAQSDLVNWLTYPTELGCVPDAIELTDVIVEADEEGTRDWFLFRFRASKSTFRGEIDPTVWLAGWSGPFPNDSAPGDVLNPGDHISNFEPWDSKTPEEHLRAFYGTALGNLRANNRESG